jgi:hypothetical protein
MDELRREDLCCTGSYSEGSDVQMLPCYGDKSHKWEHDRKTKSIMHKASGLCLDVTNVKNGEYVK